jgi:hypothetical protein
VRSQSSGEGTRPPCGRGDRAVAVFYLLFSVFGRSLPREPPAVAPLRGVWRSRDQLLPMVLLMSTETGGAPRASSLRGAATPRGATPPRSSLTWHPGRDHASDASPPFLLFRARLPTPRLSHRRSFRVVVPFSPPRASHRASDDARGTHIGVTPPPPPSTPLRHMLCFCAISIPSLLSSPYEPLRAVM